MSKISFEIRWITTGGQTRVKCFGSIRELKKFKTKELKYIESEFKYYLWDGTKHEQFVFCEKQILTKSQFNSLKSQFE